MSDMPSVVIFAPHPDDETLSMGYAMVWYLAAGYSVHLVSMNRGGNGGPLDQINGTAPCVMHGYTHNPAQEGYAPLTPEAIGAARLLEARAALGAMATVTPYGTVPATGKVFHHEGGLPDGFGGTYGQPPTQAGIDAAQEVIAKFVAEVPGAFYHTMSPTDAHPDHAACGKALRNLKNQAGSGVGAGSRFFVSRLYWGPTEQQPNNPPRTPELVAEGPEWFTAVPSTKRDEVVSVLKNRVAPVFKAWNPSAGSYGFGQHEVLNQFINNFGPNASVANLWHD